MFSFKFFLTITLLLVGMILGAIGYWKIIKTIRLLNTSEKSLYKLESLSYTIAVQKKYPEKMLKIERMSYISQGLRSLSLISVGILLSLIYVVIEYGDYSVVPMALVFILIINTFYLYSLRKLLDIRAKTLDSFFKQNGDGNKVILYKLANNSRERLIGQFIVYGAAIIVTIDLLILVVL